MRVILEGTADELKQFALGINKAIDDTEDDDTDEDKEVEDEIKRNLGEALIKAIKIESI